MRVRKAKQVKPGFTNYQPRGLADQIKFEVKKNNENNGY